MKAEAGEERRKEEGKEEEGREGNVRNNQNTIA